MGSSCAPRRLLSTAVAVAVAFLCGSAAEGSSYEGAWLNPHNLARHAVGVGPLSWDWKVAQYAQWYANKRIWDCALVHSNGPYGENIFWGSGSGWSPEQAVLAWVSEKQCYRYWSNTCAAGRECGHYTQAVWKGSTQLGCAMVECHGGRGTFVVCNYNPPGNYYGRRPY